MMDKVALLLTAEEKRNKNFISKGVKKNNLEILVNRKNSLDLQVTFKNSETGDYKYKEIYVDIKNSYNTIIVLYESHENGFKWKFIQDPETIIYEGDYVNDAHEHVDLLGNLIFADKSTDTNFSIQDYKIKLGEYTGDAIKRVEYNFNPLVETVESYNGLKTYLYINPVIEQDKERLDKYFEDIRAFMVNKSILPNDYVNKRLDLIYDLISHRIADKERRDKEYYDSLERDRIERENKYRKIIASYIPSEYIGESIEYDERDIKYDYKYILCTYIHIYIKDDDIVKIEYTIVKDDFNKYDVTITKKYISIDDRVYFRNNVSLEDHVDFLKEKKINNIKNYINELGIAKCGDFVEDLHKNKIFYKRDSIEYYTEIGSHMIIEQYPNNYCYDENPMIRRNTYQIKDSVPSDIKPSQVPSLLLDSRLVETGIYDGTVYHNISINNSIKIPVFYSNFVEEVIHEVDINYDTNKDRAFKFKEFEQFKVGKNKYLIDKNNNSITTKICSNITDNKDAYVTFDIETKKPISILISDYVFKNNYEYIRITEEYIYYWMDEHIGCYRYTRGDNKSIEELLSDEKFNNIDNVLLQLPIN